MIRAAPRWSAVRGRTGVFLLAALLASPAAALVRVPAEPGALARALDRAPAGAVLRLAPGRHRGGVRIVRPVAIEGRPGVVVDGRGVGDVLRVAAPGVVIRGLEIRGSGRDLTAMNAGIFVERGARGVHIEGNLLDDNLFGVWVDAAPAATILDNRVHGIPDVRSQDRGNGIHLYAVHGARVEGNEIWETRDGIYIDTSVGNALRGNFMHDLRYGVHYMYSHDNEVSGNRTRRTRTGYALMQSRGLRVFDNVSRQDRNYGILMNFITYSEIARNRIVGVRPGRAYATGGEAVPGAEGKALFIYNSQFNDIHDNLLQDADIGIHLTAGSEDNAIHGNSFVFNRTQVKYVASRSQEWSRNGRGNYWSDYLGWDLDGDGIGDRPYEPNDAVDKLLWKYPVARILMNSPGIEILRWVQIRFPVLRPAGVRDSYPLMRPTRPPEPSAAAGAAEGER